MMISELIKAQGLCALGWMAIEVNRANRHLDCFNEQKRGFVWAYLGSSRFGTGLLVMV